MNASVKLKVEIRPIIAYETVQVLSSVELLGRNAQT
ncbi:Hypothetical protein OINT_2001824 [Brucella intermedia LMG 3301]|uniref:Uncharacterized protein n=1 Tax=Brucella intermedia LMG 3301 TaxID=641118 RepID=C4WQS7_9HYPH|nr:Hypothetical protein OINT_2001824 [Brucella intermedia LMG 3301]